MAHVISPLTQIPVDRELAHYRMLTERHHTYPEYYTAPLFLAGILLAVAISLLMAVATVSLLRRQRRGEHK